MRIGNRLFPYPVLNQIKSLSSSSNTSFEMVYEGIEQNSNNIIIKGVRFDCSNEEINRLIFEGLILVYLYIECSSTVYREKIVLNNQPKDILLDKNVLSDEVIISAIGIAENNIIKMNGNFFDEDYNEKYFDVEKGCILLIDDGISFKVERDESSDDLKQSIFVVVKCAEITDERIRVQSEGKKIKIEVPSESFDKYINNKSNSYFSNIYFSILLIPALSSSLDAIRHIDFESIEEEYAWFRTVKKSYERITNSVLTEEEFGNISSLELSQILVNDPITKAIDETFVLSTGSNLEDNDE